MLKGQRGDGFAAQGLRGGVQTLDNAAWVVSTSRGIHRSMYSDQWLTGLDKVFHGDGGLGGFDSNGLVG